MKNKKFGFTLIELLTVVAVIGLLSTIAVASFSNARAKARDARRKSDLSMITKATDLYYDKWGAYPYTGTGYSINPQPWITSCIMVGFDCLPGETPTSFSEILPNIPVDPLNTAGSVMGGTGYEYMYRATDDRQDYALIALLENSDDPDRCELKCGTWPFAAGTRDYICKTGSINCPGSTCGANGANGACNVYSAH